MLRPSSFLDNVHMHMLANQAESAERIENMGSTLSEASTAVEDDERVQAAARPRSKTTEMVIYDQKPAVDGVYRRWDPVSHAATRAIRSPSVSTKTYCSFGVRLAPFRGAAAAANHPRCSLSTQDDFVANPPSTRAPTIFATTRRPKLVRSTSVRVAVLDTIFQPASARCASKIPRHKSELRSDEAPCIPGVTVHRLTGSR